MKINSIIPIKGGASDPLPASGERSQVVTGLGEMKFSAGQLIKAEVISVNQEGRALLDINGRMVAATTSVPLEAGNEIWLEVKGEGSASWFSLAGRKGAAAEFLRMILSEGTALNRAAASLTGGLEAQITSDSPRLFAPFFEGFMQAVSNGEASPDKVARIVSSLTEPAFGAQAQKGPFMGFWERFQEMIELFSGQAGKGKEVQVSSGDLQKISKLLELFQSFNSQPRTPDTEPAFLFPCFFSSSSGWGEWLFCADSEGGKDGRGSQTVYNLSFFLNMSSLGEVHVQAKVKDGVVSGDFFFYDQAAVDHVEKRLPELADVLESCGMRVGAINCRKSNENQLQVLKNILEEYTGLRQDAILDIRA